jgi:glyoxylase-like metal-dependent hydrolase (beta-lactamase superfamily II)
MVDAGSPHDWKALNQALAKHHLKMSDISMLILSHGHGDHAALSKAIRDSSHCKIVVGRGDLPMVRNGHNDKLKSNNMTAVLMKPIIDFKYPPFEPDIVVDSALDLHPYGLAGRVLAVPGHTPGSLAVVLDDKRALVGDMMLGGIFGGLFFAGKPGEHYFHADKEADHKRLSELLALGVKSFYLGHGGPVERDAVIKAFAIKTQ